MRLTKVQGITFLSAADVIDFIRKFDNPDCNILADAIEQLIFKAELDLEVSDSIQEMDDK